MNKKLLALILAGMVTPAIFAMDQEVVEKVKQTEVVVDEKQPAEKNTEFFAKRWFDASKAGVVSSAGFYWNHKLYTIPATVMIPVACHLGYEVIQGKGGLVWDVTKALLTAWKADSRGLIVENWALASEIAAALLSAGVVLVDGGCKVKDAIKGHFASKASTNVEGQPAGEEDPVDENPVEDPVDENPVVVGEDSDSESELDGV